MPRLPICMNPDDKSENYENENLDICKQCWREMSEDGVNAATNIEPHLIARAFKVEDLKDGEEHPPYEDTDYTCELCGEKLTEKDN